MITAALLDAAPIGSWITWKSQFAFTVNRTAEGWMLFRRGKKVEHSGPRPAKFYAADPFDLYRLHIPADVKVSSWSSAGIPLYSWSCRSCSDFDVCFEDPSEAHDKARSHAALHAEVTAP